jgi:hypothetical protein
MVKTLHLASALIAAASLQAFLYCSVSRTIMASLFSLIEPSNHLNDGSTRIARLHVAHSHLLAPREYGIRPARVAPRIRLHP